MTLSWAGRQMTFCLKKFHEVSSFLHKPKSMWMSAQLQSIPSLPWKQHSYFKIIQLLTVDYWHESFQSKLIDSLWSGQMRHGKYFKLVHLSCSDM